VKYLFLTSSPGYGHIRAAEAIIASLEGRYPEVETQCLNITNLIDEQVSKAIQEGYLRMTAEQPALYQKLYDLDKEFYQQLAGKIPADQQLIDFLDQQQRDSFPEHFSRSRFSLGTEYKSIDSALFNSLINGICSPNPTLSGRLITQGLLVLICNILSSRLKKFVAESAPDCLVATQMYPNALLSRLIHKGAIKQPVIGVVTDFGAHGAWVRDSTDLYCVAHEDVAKSLVQQGVSASRIRVTGIPLMPTFANLPTQEQARQNLGLQDLPTLLITGGECAIGVLDLVEHLMQDQQHHYQVAVTAGRHNDMQRLDELVKKYSNRFHVYTWRTDMTDIFCAADLVLGKPGGLTLSESLACGKPFIATCCLGGQELHNVQFLQSRGIGLYVELPQLLDVLSNLFTDSDLLQSMKLRAQQLGRPNAAQAVVAELDKIMTIRDPIISTSLMTVGL
jgi:processive 1,2-diacylglycerol beta-glucosyltransferase